MQVGIILCCIGVAIFGITEVPTDGVDFDTAHSVDGDVEAPPAATAYDPPVPPSTGAPQTEASSPSITTADLLGGTNVTPPVSETPLVELVSSADHGLD